MLMKQKRVLVSVFLFKNTLEFFLGYFLKWEYLNREKHEVLNILSVPRKQTHFQSQQ